MLHDSLWIQGINTLLYSSDPILAKTQEWEATDVGINFTLDLGHDMHALTDRPYLPTQSIFATNF